MASPIEPSAASASTRVLRHPVLEVGPALLRAAGDAAVDARRRGRGSRPRTRCSRAAEPLGSSATSVFLLRARQHARFSSRGLGHRPTPDRPADRGPSSSRSRSSSGRCPWPRPAWRARRPRSAPWRCPPAAGPRTSFLPTEAWTMPALSTRYSTLPPLFSETALRHVHGDRAELRVGHQAARAEHLSEPADHAHHVGRRDHAIEVEPALVLDLLGELLAADVVGAGLARLLLLLALREHQDAHGLARCRAEARWRRGPSGRRASGPRRG
jgi:hypothetical protein